MTDLDTIDTHADLTDKQTDILLFIAKFTGTHGFPPSVREIGAAVGLRSPSSVHAQLATLAAAGHLRRHGKSDRALVLVLPDGLDR